MQEASTVHALVLDAGALFIADTSVSYDPSAALIAETAIKASQIVRGFGIAPKVALISHSNFGSRDTPSSAKMREALAILRRLAPGPRGRRRDAGRHAPWRRRSATGCCPAPRSPGMANLLVMPSLDAASAAYNVLKAVTGAITIGPILIGPQRRRTSSTPRSPAAASST